MDYPCGGRLGGIPIGFTSDIDSEKKGEDKKLARGTYDASTPFMHAFVPRIRPVCLARRVQDGTKQPAGVNIHDVMI